MIKKRNELAIFEEFRIKSNIISNKKIKDHFPNEDSLKRLNILCNVDNKGKPINWWKKIREKLYQVDEFGEFIHENDKRFIKVIPNEQKLLKNKSEVLVCVNEHNIILSHWLKLKNGDLMQVNIKEKKDFSLEKNIKSWLRDKAIESVGHEIRTYKKKAYEYSKDELLQMIEDHEKKIIKDKTMTGVKIAAMSFFGINPFL